MEKRSGGQVILNERDKARDHLITSGDVPRGPELNLECHGYDSIPLLGPNS